MVPYIGQIQAFPYTFAPHNWVLCDGRLLQVNENLALFSLLGTTFGGDGRTTFGLPNLTGAEPDANMRYYIALDGSYPQRS
ncbi:Tail Collar domain protein [Desulfofarcimen acetoxidans DSM 771]|jgi:microcystin-dependent protein|uniref:Tail Collar domain protein n=2 Tax=Desulfofarcimen acetoxidans TaxID=58138 RepID=C8W2G6_DESAS|nr:tail fiber protein [Desulfofarcimen acetoxidans]ACV63650.1 Tail Collar domain protein [Desulfofarcimen acetoxidans DSM 771]